MDRNRLKGKLGDSINAIMSAAGMNFRKLIHGVSESLDYPNNHLVNIPTLFWKITHTWRK